MDVLEFIGGTAKPAVVAVSIGGGAEVHVRGMNSVHRAAFLSLLTQAVAENSTVPDHVIVAWGLCNPDGSPPIATPEERLGKLESLDGKVLNRLAKKILDLSGFTKKAVENAEKN